jgi:hypothetical protein
LLSGEDGKLSLTTGARELTADAVKLVDETQIQGDLLRIAMTSCQFHESNGLSLQSFAINAADSKNAVSNGMPRFENIFAGFATTIAPSLFMKSALRWIESLSFRRNSDIQKHN